MMKEYIERELLKEQFLKWLPQNGDWDHQSMDLHPIENIAVSAIMEIEEAPAADVVEVVHGEWERIPYSFAGGYRCSCCGCKSTEKHWDYCPKCGTKMDGKKV